MSKLAASHAACELPEQLLHAHFAEQMRSAVDIACDPQAISNVDTNRATVVGVPGEVIDGRLKGPIKIDSNQLSFRVQYRATRVATRCVGIVQNGHRHLPSLGCTKRPKSRAS